MNRIIVFGANGFIGKHLTIALAKDKSNLVVAFDRFSDYVSGGNNEFDKYDNIIIRPGDFFNHDDVIDSLKGVDYVFHLISATTPASSSHNPLIDIDTNLRGSIDLLQACVKSNVKKILYPSSGGTIYGDSGDKPIKEDVCPKPRSPYGIIKLTIEYYLHYFYDNFGLDYMIYRIANPYGPGQNINGKQGVIPIFMHKILIGEPIDIYGDGKMIRDYIYISDLIDMITATYNKKTAFNEYNIGSGVGISVNEIVDTIQLCTNKDVHRRVLAAPASFVKNIVLDSNRFCKEFDIYPKINLKEGIEQTWQYVKNI
jgi:UDP-glucose 4-epimerase